MQRNWIGKSHGVEIDFEINGEKWPIFTTRPDTLFGVTFMVVAAQHPRLNELVTGEQRKKVGKFLKKLSSVSEKDAERLEKEGVFSGSYAVNPANGEGVPIWVGNFVVADYGSGMVMAVPAHDQRDFEFAKKYDIPIRQVVAPLFVDSSGPDAVRKNKKTVERDAVFGIVKHWKEDKYFCLDWKKFGWRSAVIGGIDEGESAEEAVVREVKEETGYQDVKSVRRISMEVHSNFFAKHKDENRYGRFKTFLVELGSDKWIEPEAEHIKNHVGVWVDGKNVKDFFTLENHTYLWDDYLKGEGAYTGEGVLIGSDKFDGLNNDTAKGKIAKWLEGRKSARKVVNFKLRDWGISRQRYWGTPIPIIHCKKCGAVPVSEKDLPVELPKDVKFGKGNPLESSEKWLSVKCPKCGGKGRRESDTMDTFANSSWYFLRFCDPKNDKKIFDEKKVKYWCPVDFYVGGAEHACMHLIYSRFYVKFLRDIGLIDFDEPAIRLFHQGMINDEKGEKMSKSKGNVVEPLEMMAKYGVDTTRYFLLSMASPDKGFNWSDKEIAGSARFVRKIVDFFDRMRGSESGVRDSEEVLSRVNGAIKGVGDDIVNLEYRAATIKLKELFNFLSKEDGVSKEVGKNALKLLVPFCPHVCEEVWERMGEKGFVSLAKWPIVDDSKIRKKGKVSDLNGKIIEDVKYVLGKVKGEKVYLYVMPFEVGKVDIGKIGKAVGKKVEVFAVSDSGKYDPKGKAKKARPGRVSVYVE
jgi:leucyl-tRNA synthetase